jgi:synaptojanin
LARDFLLLNFESWITPIIRGCKFLNKKKVVSIKTIKLNDNEVRISLFSRQSPKRIGTRLNVRGIDEIGNVVNFVETEQILEFLDNFYSIITIRGSIFLFLKEKVFRYFGLKNQI